jgi:hypothetical protein
MRRQISAALGGCREAKWVMYKQNVPAFRAKVDELTAEIDRLKRDKPEGWKDLTARHADDIEGLKAMIDRAEKQ